MDQLNYLFNWIAKDIFGVPAYLVGLMTLVALVASLAVPALHAQDAWPTKPISMVAPSRVPMVSAPFIMNFMLLVPLAS